MPKSQSGQSHTQSVVLEERLNGHWPVLLRAVEQGASLVLIADAEGSIEYVNGRFTDTTGYTPEEIIGRKVQSFMSGVSSGEASDSLWTAIASGDDWQGDSRFETKNGSLLWTAASFSPIRDETGDVTHVLAILEDVTARKRAEAAEQAQRVLAEALRDSAAALTSTLDLDRLLDLIMDNVGRVVPHDAAEVMLLAGGQARVVRCRGYRDARLEEAVLNIRLAVDQTANLRQMMAGIKPVVISDTRADPDWIQFEETNWVQSHVGAPISLGEEVIGFLSLNSAQTDYFSDEHASHLKAFADQAAIAIRNARQFADLEVRNRELDAFSHTVAHELKVPLNSLVGNIELLGLDVPSDSPDSLLAMKHIQRSAMAMGKMIDQLLLLATIRDATHLVTELDANLVIAGVVTRLKEFIADRDVTIVVEHELPPAVGYAPWIREVFANLIVNAAKYAGDENTQPRVHIRGWRRAERVYYEIQDNGAGIDAQDLPHVFERFTRFHTDQAQGLGLGLSIVQQIVTKLNGEVGVESTPGEGSTFWFWLPAPD